MVLSILQGDKEFNVICSENDLNPSMLYQGDIKYGPYLPVGKDGQKKQTYLAAWIDDATRFVVGARFYTNQKVDIIEDTLREAILTYGKPEAIYVDNGKQYRSNWLQTACAKLGIKLLHGVNVPELYYLLQPMYNDSLHLGGDNNTVARKMKSCYLKTNNLHDTTYIAAVVKQLLNVPEIGFPYANGPRVLAPIIAKTFKLCLRGFQVYCSVDFLELCRKGFVILAWYVFQRIADQMHDAALHYNSLED